MSIEYRRALFDFQRALNQYGLLTDELNEYLEYAMKYNKGIDVEKIRLYLSKQIKEEVINTIRKEENNGQQTRKT